MENACNGTVGLGREPESEQYGGVAALSNDVAKHIVFVMRRCRSSCQRNVSRYVSASIVSWRKDTVIVRDGEEAADAAGALEGAAEVGSPEVVGGGDGGRDAAATLGSGLFADDVPVVPEVGFGFCGLGVK